MMVEFRIIMACAASVFALYAHFKEACADQVDAAREFLDERAIRRMKMLEKRDIGRRDNDIREKTERDVPPRSDKKGNPLGLKNDCDGARSDVRLCGTPLREKGDEGK